MTCAFLLGASRWGRYSQKRPTEGNVANCVQICCAGPGGRQSLGGGQRSLPFAVRGGAATRGRAVALVGIVPSA